jgi:hypothetical protein
VRKEVAAGLVRPDAAVVPVLLEGAAMPTEADLPDPLKGLAARHARALSAENYAAELDEFVNAIERGLIQDMVERQRQDAEASPVAAQPGPAVG